MSARYQVGDRVLAQMAKHRDAQYLPGVVVAVRFVHGGPEARYDVRFSNGRMQKCCSALSLRPRLEMVA